MGSTLFKSFLIGSLALALALTLIFTVVPLLGESFQASMFISAVIGSYGIGMPVGYYTFRQSDRLQQVLAELERSHAELAEKASRDHMTGLLNRENFFSMFEHRRRVCDQGALLIIDIDHFKRINDNWGHPVGDEALVTVSKAIVQTIRDGDVAGRIGGEEFAIFLPGASATRAELLAERIRSTVAGIEFCPTEFVRMPLSVSVGGAMCRSDADLSDVIRAADRRLYEAKRAGRNRTVFSAVMPRAA